MSYRPDISNYLRKHLDHLPAAIHHLPAILDHLPAILDHLPATIDHLPATIDHLPAILDHLPAILVRHGYPMESGEIMSLLFKRNLGIGINHSLLFGSIRTN